MDRLEDKDVFLVKLPNKFKNYLKDAFIFSLGSEDETIGTLDNKEKIDEAETS